MLAPEPFLDVGRPGRRPRRRGRHGRAEAASSSAGSPRARRVLAFAHAEPGTRWSRRPRRRSTATRTATAGRSPASRSRCRTAPAPTSSWSAPRCPTAAPGCSSSAGDADRARPAPATAPTTAAAPPASTFADTPAEPLGEPAATRPRRSSGSSPMRPDRRRPRGDRRDGDRSTRPRRLPEDPQAVRRHAQQVPGADLPGRGHVRLPRAGPQHRALGDDGAGRRSGGDVGAAAVRAAAAGQPRRPAHRQGGHPAARRHRR